MKKILFLITLTFIVLISSSCKNNYHKNNDNDILSNTSDSEDNQEQKKSDNEPVKDNDDDNKDDNPKKEENKPQTVDEIIALADSYSVASSIKDFTLDGILQETQLSYTEDAGEEYQNSTAYLGDSVSLGLGVFGNHPKELVLAVGSINPMDAATKNFDELGGKNFPDALSELNVDRAILTFGANAISVQSESTFLTSYKLLIDKIKETSPECEIIIQSISPVAKICQKKVFTNELINRSNLLLLILAYSEDVKFLNSAPALKDEDGYLKSEYCSNSDGIHINQSAYSVWINFMRTHALISE